VLTMPFPVEDAKTLRVRLRVGSGTPGFEDQGTPADELIVGLEL
jgi:hypothetical protein